MALVRDGDEDEKENAAYALVQLTNSAANGALIVDGGAIAPLVALVREGSDGGKEEAVSALANLVPGGHMSGTMVAEAGGKEPLRLLLRKGTEEGRDNAAIVLSSMPTKTCCALQ